jgi:hypothetical protein
MTKPVAGKLARMFVCLLVLLLSLIAGTVLSAMLVKATTL